MASREMEMATQKTPHEAAALIQARVRGHQHRSKQSRVIKAITKLQARQRGRYTRREYQKLLEFYNEQESFLAESKRRQLRMWHREQELYFLQHTTAEELDRIRQFQYEKSACRIQREWKRLHPKPLEDVDVSGLGKPFDPFGLIAEPGSLSAASTITNRKTLKKELYGELPHKVSVSQDTEKLARRRAEIQDKLQRRRKDQDKQIKENNQEKTSRRELFNTLVALRQETTRRLEETSEKYRKTRGQRDLEAAQLSASCRNRLAFLQDESRIQSLLNTGKRPASQDQIARERRRFEEDTATWSEARKREAWENHTRVLQSVLGKTQWYETFIAGEKQDIRRVYAESPWENVRQVWQWPPHAKAKEEPSKDAAGVATPATAMDRFMFGLDDEDGDENSPHNQTDGATQGRPAPMRDELASSWWRAHATQSHFSYTRQQHKQQRLERRRITGNTHAIEDAQVTPEMLANPRFYELYTQSINKNRKGELGQGVDARLSRLQRQIQQKVVEIETQIDVNTREIVEKANLIKHQEARKTKEELASIQIQRTVRGKLGRKRAQEHLAQYFVMVRGRAIRKGKCEECGEAQAVLECKQCEESLHFCPVCWVQVHSTRRRKTHVPIPMALEVATYDSKPAKGTKSSGLRIETYATAGYDSGAINAMAYAHQERPEIQKTAHTLPDPIADRTTNARSASSDTVVDTKPRARPHKTDFKAAAIAVPPPDALEERSIVEEKPATLGSDPPAEDAVPLKRIVATKPRRQEANGVSTDEGVPTATKPIAEFSIATKETETAKAGVSDDSKPRTLAAAKAAALKAAAASTISSDASASQPTASAAPDDEMKPDVPIGALAVLATRLPSTSVTITTRSEDAIAVATPEPEKKTTTPQARSRVAQSGGDAAAAPRPSLRERMAKGPGKPSSSPAVDVAEKPTAKPTEQPATQNDQTSPPSDTAETSIVSTNAEETTNN